MYSGAEIEQIQVRFAGAGDAAEIARIQVESSRAAYAGIIDAGCLDDLDQQRRETVWVHRVATEVFGAIFIAERAQRAIGYCAVLTPSLDVDAADRVAALSSMYVDPQAWRGGCGTALIEAAVQWLRAGAHWSALTLWVFEANEPARAFYARLGFTADGSRQTQQSLGAPEIRMRLGL